VSRFRTVFPLGSVTQVVAVNEEKNYAGIVQVAEAIHDVVETHRPRRAGRLAQRGSRLNGAGIRCPRRQNGALFVEREIGIPNDVRRLCERARRVEKRVEIEEIVAASVERLFRSFRLRTHGNLSLRQGKPTSIGLSSARPHSFAMFQINERSSRPDALSRLALLSLVGR
jgi:hypothetical protein